MHVDALLGPSIFEDLPSSTGRLTQLMAPYSEDKRGRVRSEVVEGHAWVLA